MQLALVNEVKKCPFCAEEIQDAAVVCKHCKRELPAHQTKETIQCPFCKATIARGRETCPACGDDLSGVAGTAARAVSTATPSALKQPVNPAVALFALGVVGVVLYMMLSGSPSVSGPTPAATSNATASSSGSATSLPPAQRNAARSAQSYLAISGFSRQGLIGQLSSEFGNQFSVADATAAVDSLNIDWNTQAARSAAAYLKISGFSCRGLIDQLSSENGSNYTVEQATYGATQAGIC
ncbi:MAG: Ltp family lipoprotein [Vicinamibacterales bacterium]